MLYDFPIVQQLSVFVKLERTDGRPGSCFCVTGATHFCCGVYEMLTSQRWADDKQRCPVGIQIYLRQVTPSGSQQLDSSLCLSFPHTHTHSCLQLTCSLTCTQTYISVRAHTHRQALQHTFVPGVAASFGGFCRASLTFPYHDRHL